jgi:hypothetical protein
VPLRFANPYTFDASRSRHHRNSKRPARHLTRVWLDQIRNELSRRSPAAMERRVLGGGGGRGREILENAAPVAVDYNEQIKWQRDLTNMFVRT